MAGGLWLVNMGRVRPDNIELLIDRANNGDAAALERLREIAREHVENGTEMPLELDSFMVEWFLQGRQED